MGKLNQGKLLKICLAVSTFPKNIHKMLNTVGQHFKKQALTEFQEVCFSNLPPGMKKWVRLLFNATLLITFKHKKLSSKSKKIHI